METRKGVLLQSGFFPVVVNYVEEHNSYAVSEMSLMTSRIIM